jgi:dihydroorotase
MKAYFLKNALVINEKKKQLLNILIEDGLIVKIIPNDEYIDLPIECRTLDLYGKWLLPGVIDDQVHFRDPGLTEKADLYTESKAAVAGGVTSFMDMPNTIPNVLTQELLEEKYAMAAEKSLATYSFYMGVSNHNVAEVLKTDPKKVCGIKIFLGASTGNMLVDNQETLEEIFVKAPTLVAVHCEDEPTIQRNLKQYREKYQDDIPMEAHPLIRSEEACYLSSSHAIDLARKHGTRLHILHLSTARETALFDNSKPLEEKRITAEVCVHHLWFSDEDYPKKGSMIKWNPAIKTRHDADDLLKALLDDRIDVLATDHAPHQLELKKNSYLKAPSGGPMVQHSLVAMLEMARLGKISVEKVVEKMCHRPAQLFQIERRGFVREGYYADLVVVDPNAKWEVKKDNILYKCGWSPLEGELFHHQVQQTFVNGHLVYDEGSFDESVKAKRLIFNR